MVIEVTLPDVLVKEIEYRAKSRGLSRSAFIRMLLTQEIGRGEFVPEDSTNGG
jgi:metal-responsive CopG/Arc/MetJ family transcriptional regulator